jgi:hypothetical protein
MVATNQPRTVAKIHKAILDGVFIVVIANRLVMENTNTDPESLLTRLGHVVIMTVTWGFLALLNLINYQTGPKA